MLDVFWLSELLVVVIRFISFFMALPHSLGIIAVICNLL